MNADPALEVVLDNDFPENGRSQPVPSQAGDIIPELEMVTSPARARACLSQEISLHPPHPGRW